MKALIIVFLSLIVFINQWKYLRAQRVSQVNLKLSFNFYWNIQGSYMEIGFTRDRRRTYYHSTSQSMVAVELTHKKSRQLIYYKPAKSAIVANSFPLAASSLDPISNPLELTLDEGSYPGILQKDTVELKISVTDQIPGSSSSREILDIIVYNIPIQPPYFLEHGLISRYTTLQPSFGVSISVRCDDHVYGKKCDTPCKPNSNYVCSTEGKMLCLPGWEDPANNCRTPMTSSCSANPCMNGGTCVPAGTDFTCTCPTGFGGVRCQSCGLNCNSGICLIQSGKPTCRCPSNASGPNCGSRIDPCAVHNPCKNGGKCHTKVSASGHLRYLCDCSLGFTGLDCMDKADACRASLCSKGSTCVSKATVALGYTCQCPNHSSGLLCDNDVDECKLNPDLCDKGTETCIDTYGGYFCEVKKEQGHCKNVDCGKGGTCIELDYKYYCKCVIGWSGHNCNFSRPEQFKINIGMINNKELNGSDGSENDPSLAVLAMGLAVVAAGLRVIC